MKSDDKPANIVEEMVQEEKAKGPTNKTIDALNKLSLPAGVDIKIKAGPTGG